jgi:hypothetical protein
MWIEEPVHELGQKLAGYATCQQLLESKDNGCYLHKGSWCFRHEGVYNPMPHVFHGLNVRLSR